MKNTMFAMKKTLETAAHKANLTLQSVMQECKQDMQSYDALCDLASYVKDDSLMLQQQGEQKMMALVKRYTILLDTCAIVHDNFPLLMQHMLPMLREQKKQVLVPASVVHELKKLGTYDLAMRETVRSACDLLMSLQYQGVLRVLNAEDPDFGDQDICRLATKHRVEMDIMVITLDRKLSRDLTKLNDMTSVVGHRVKVCRINRHGYLSGYHSEEEQAELRAAQRTSRNGETRGADNRQVQRSRSGEVYRTNTNNTSNWQMQRPAPAVEAGAVSHARQTTMSANGDFVTRTCFDCGKTFVIYASEADYFRQNNMVLPRRCKPCRAQRRALKENCMAGELSFMGKVC